MLVTPTKSIHAVAGVIRERMQKEAMEVAKQAAHKELDHQLSKVLANGYMFYFKTHAFHWNIEGSNFPQYHEFLEKIYTTVYEKLDATAEQIRALGGYAPSTLTQILVLSTVRESQNVRDPKEMFKILSVDNEKIIGDMMAAYRLAEQANELGLSNYLQDRINDHKKLGWMIASTIKGE